MAKLPILEILQVGFAGIAFLLAYLAYRLLGKEAEKAKPSEGILRTIRSYMLFAFAMGGLAIGAQVFEKSMSNNTLVDTDRRIAHLNARIDGIKLTSKDSGGSPPYQCGNEQKAEPNTLTVMSGLRDGTSCKKPNINYYKEIGISIPK